MRQPHLVSVTPLSAIPPATKTEEPQPPPATKKGLANIKPFPLNLCKQWPLSCKCLPLPLHNLQLLLPLYTLQRLLPLQLPLQVLEQEDYGTASSFTTSRPSSKGMLQIRFDSRMRPSQKAERPPSIKIPIVADPLRQG